MHKDGAPGNQNPSGDEVEVLDAFDKACAVYHWDKTLALHRRLSQSSLVVAHNRLQSQHKWHARTREDG